MRERNLAFFVVLSFALEGDEGTESCLFVALSSGRLNKRKGLTTDDDVGLGGETALSCGFMSVWVSTDGPGTGSVWVSTDGPGTGSVWVSTDGPGAGSVWVSTDGDVESEKLVVAGLSVEDVG